MDAADRIFQLLKEDFGFDGATGSVRFNLKDFDIRHLLLLQNVHEVQLNNQLIQLLKLVFLVLHNHRACTKISEPCAYKVFIPPP